MRTLSAIPIFRDAAQRVAEATRCCPVTRRRSRPRHAQEPRYPMMHIRRGARTNEAKHFAQRGSPNKCSPKCRSRTASSLRSLHARTRLGAPPRYFSTVLLGGEARREACLRRRPCSLRVLAQAAPQAETASCPDGQALPGTCQEARWCSPPLYHTT